MYWNLIVYQFPTTRIPGQTIEMTVLPYEAPAEAAALSDAKYVYRSQRQTFRTLIVMCCINWTYHDFNVCTIAVMNKLIYGMLHFTWQLRNTSLGGQFCRHFIANLFRYLLTRIIQIERSSRKSLQKIKGRHYFMTQCIKTKSPH